MTKLGLLMRKVGCGAAVVVSRWATHGPAAAQQQDLLCLPSWQPDNQPAGCRNHGLLYSPVSPLFAKHCYKGQGGRGAKVTGHASGKPCPGGTAT